jgi:hypothetical protein
MVGGDINRCRKTMKGWGSWGRLHLGDLGMLCEQKLKTQMPSKQNNW